MRLFFAVPLSTATRAAIDAGLATVRARVEGQPIVWEPAHKLHVTLRFLGEVEPSRVETLVAAATPVAARHASFALELDGLFAFPDAHAPRILWLGAARGAESLGRLAADLDAALAPVGCAREERPYVAHVTCGRARSSAGEQALGSLLAAGPAIPRLTTTVDVIALFESRARVYHSLHEFGLGR